MRKEVTKEYLISLGYSCTEDGTVWKNGKPVPQIKQTRKHKVGKDLTYMIVMLYDPQYYAYCKENNKKLSGQKCYLVSRVVYAWFHEVCPAEFDVDHVDDDPFNNSISNLQLLTRKDNLHKRKCFHGTNQKLCKLVQEDYDKYFEEKDRLDWEYTKIKGEEADQVKKIKELQGISVAAREEFRKDPSVWTKYPYKVSKRNIEIAK